MTISIAPADAAIAELLAFADLLDTVHPDRHSDPTPCDGWTIDDLARHVAAGACRSAEAVYRARLGSTTTPNEIDLTTTDYATVIRASAAHLRAALHNPPPDWPAVPIAIGAYPFDLAMQCLVVEFGVHHNDLARAAGELDAPFTRATVDALLGFGELYLLRQASPIDVPATFTIQTPSASMSISCDGQVWSAGDHGGPRCVINTSDDAAVRLMLRRLDIADPQISVDDPAGLADRFADAIRPL